MPSRKEERATTGTKVVLRRGLRSDISRPAKVIRVSTGREIVKNLLILLKLRVAFGHVTKSCSLQLRMKDWVGPSQSSLRTRFRVE